jgi:hypothetical protein
MIRIHPGRVEPHVTVRRVERVDFRRPRLDNFKGDRLSPRAVTELGWYEFDVPPVENAVYVLWAAGGTNNKRSRSGVLVRDSGMRTQGTKLIVMEMDALRFEYGFQQFELPAGFYLLESTANRLTTQDLTAFRGRGIPWGSWANHDLGAIAKAYHDHFGLGTPDAGPRTPSPR